MRIPFVLLLPACLTGQVHISRTPIGSSAISVNSIIATAYQLGGEASELVADPKSKMVFVSVAGGAKSYVAAISTADDSLRWTTAGTDGHLLVCSNAVFSFTGGNGAQIDKSRGNLQPLGGEVLFQPSDETVVVWGTGGATRCVRTADGNSVWTASLPASEQVGDVRPLQDSVWLVSSGGLHAFHARKGILWSLPQSMSSPDGHGSGEAQFNASRLRKNGDMHVTRQQGGMGLLSSNICEQNGKIWFAGREKLVCCDRNGSVNWELPLGNYPVSRMFLYKSDSALFLVNTAVCWSGESLVAYGQPFVLRIDPVTGKETGKWEGDLLEGLADFMPMGRKIRLATREAIFEAGATGHLKSVSLMDPSYGNLVELIDGNRYHSLNEGYFVTLNAIDKAIYYRSDNGKIYALERNNVKREYNSSAVYRFSCRSGDLVFLGNTDRTLVTDGSYELQCSIRSPGRTYIGNDKVYILNGDRVYAVPLKELR